MPITKSAKKSLKVSRAKQAQNYIKTVALEKAIRKADVKTVSEAISLIDKGAKTGLMHKNKAARLKSQLTKKFGTPKVEAKPVVKTEAKAKTVKKAAAKK
ncbi:MAG: 30S ribosomal protein S20 [Candidatus Berkelbacteria bacterium]